MEVHAYHAPRSSLRAFCRTRPRGSRMTRLFFLFLPTLPSALFLSLIHRVYKVRVRGTIERLASTVSSQNTLSRSAFFARRSYRCSSSKQRELDDKKLILCLEIPSKYLSELIATRAPYSVKRVPKFQKAERFAACGESSRRFSRYCKSLRFR